MEMNTVDVARLRQRDIDVLWCIGRNMNKQKIAEELGITVNTINQHIAHIKTRLAIATKQERWTIEQLAEFARKEL